MLLPQMCVCERERERERMGAMVMHIFAVLMFVMGCTHKAEAYNEEAKVIHVGGKVLCQDCTQGWNDWVKGARPIKGGKVSVTLMDERGRVVYYGSDLTDDVGQFDLIINKSINGKELNPKLSSVRLVSSPDATCNIPTNFAGGRSGVKLSRPSLVYRDLVKYTLGPFYYSTPLCDDPDTHVHDDTHGNNY